jgi:hypothetical protein
MENSNFRSELECLICLDIIVEPVTTVCGKYYKFFSNFFISEIKISKLNKLYLILHK